MGNGRLTGVGREQVLLMSLWMRKTKKQRKNQLLAVFPPPPSCFSPSPGISHCWFSYTFSVCLPSPVPPRLTVYTPLYSLPTVLTWDNHPPVSSYRKELEGTAKMIKPFHFPDEDTGREKDWFTQLAKVAPLGGVVCL